MRDLADALATQGSRLKRIAAESPTVAPPAQLVEALLEQAVQVRVQSEELVESLAREAEPEDAEGQVVQLKADRAPTRADERRSNPHGLADAAHTLAIEMKIEGKSRDEVEQTLVETFGLSDVSAIVNDVFTTAGS